MNKSPIHPDEFKIVRKTLADGTVKEYRYPKKTSQASPKVPSVGTIGAVLRLYCASPEWKGTKVSTKRSRIIYLKELERIAEVPIRELRRRVILQFRDAIASGRGTGAANQFIQSTSAFLSWALDREWVDANAASRIGMLPYKPLPAWTKEMARDAICNLPTHLSRAVMLALFTGQRRSDLCAMRWDDIRGNMIHVIQVKTGTELWLPIHPILAQEMENWPKTCDHILTGVRGGPLTTFNITRSMNDAQSRGIIPLGFNMHGLRKLAATLLAEAGCSTHEIAAITGHKTLKMVEHYTRSADQKRMANEAFSRAETAFWKPEETDLQIIENKRTPLLNQ